ncbi:MAG: hypothetical protein ACI4DK_11295 [Lachnospiraceae bacterium]
MIDKFLLFEEKNGFLVDEISGFRYWFFIRDKVFSKIANLEPEANGSSNISKKIDSTFGTNVMGLSQKKITLGDLISVLKNLTFKNPVFYKKQHDILLLASPRRILMDGKYYAYWTDGLADHYKERAITAESLEITTHNRPYWNNNVIELDALDVIPILMYRIKKIPKSIKETIHNKSLVITECLNKEFALNIDCTFIEILITSRYSWYLFKKKNFYKLLNNIKPKVIIEVCGYSTNNLIINELSKKIGIITIEVQHGIIGNNHIGYNYLVPRDYVNLPSKLFVYSNYWKKTCRFPIGNENIIPTGYPFAEMQLKKHPPHIKEEGIITILVLSQPIFYSELLQNIYDLIGLLKKERINFRLIFKLHPTEYSQPIANWSKISKFEEVEIIGNSKKQLYELFSVSDIQIGVTSTAIFEGLLYELKTYILNIGNARIRMKDLCEEKYAIFCENINDCAKRIICTIQNKNNSRPEDAFFKENALDNMINIIDALIL